MEYYSTIKENAIESVLIRWMKPEPERESPIEYINIYIRAMWKNHPPILII